METESTFHQNVVVRYSQKIINTLAIDSSGRFAVLGGRKALYIVDLEKPAESSRTLLQQSTTWDVGAIEWNPHPAASSTIASSSNQDLLIWSLADDRLQATIQTHQRAVSDLGWSHSDPNVLATCSADTYIYLWDVRSPKRPLKLRSFCAHTEGATQVKWNRVSNVLLASAHAGGVLVWDIRNEAQPAIHITAHRDKIYAIDWSHDSDSNLLTCSSQDKQVKFWNTNTPRECKGIIYTGTPVIKAKYTPFSGLSVTTMAERGDYSIRMWSTRDIYHHQNSTSSPAPSSIQSSLSSSSSSLSTPSVNVSLCNFTGHTDSIRVFDWRVRSSDTNGKEVQLVSWSKDSCLRLWKVDQNQALQGVPSKPSSTPLKSSLSSSSIIDSGIFSIPTSITDSPVRSFGTIPTPDIIVSNIAVSPASSLSNPLASSGSISDSPDLPEDYPSTINMLTMDLDQEFHSIFRKSMSGMFPSAMIRTDLFSRTCTVKLELIDEVNVTASIVATMRMVFPTMYPHKAAPTTEITLTGSPSAGQMSQSRVRMIDAIKEIAEYQVHSSMPCLEMAIRGFTVFLIDEAKKLGLVNPITQMPSPNNAAASVAPAIPSSQPISSQPTSSSLVTTPPSIITPLSKARTTIAGSAGVGVDDSRDPYLPCPRLSGACLAADGRVVLFRSLSYKSLGCPRSYRDLCVKLNDSVPITSSNSTSSSITQSSASSNKSLLLLSPSPSISSLGGSFLLGGTGLSNLNASSPSAPSSIISDLVADTRVIVLPRLQAPAPVSIDLARSYHLSLASSDVQRLCKLNEQAAIKANRPDLVKVWKSMALITDAKLFSAKMIDWIYHPFARDLVHNIYQHYARIRDVQTLSMMTCILTLCLKQSLRDNVVESDTNITVTELSPSPVPPPPPPPLPVPSPQLQPWSSVLNPPSFVNTYLSTRRQSKDSILRSQNLSTSPTSIASSSPVPDGSFPLVAMAPTTASSTINASLFNLPSPQPTEAETPGVDSNFESEFTLVPPKYQSYAMHHVECYAELLYRWGMLEQRAEVLKTAATRSSAVPQQGIVFGIACFKCHRSLDALFCRHCKGYGFKCSICHCAVKKMSCFCIQCGHGGHADHIKEWHAVMPVCPISGCGCNCILAVQPDVSSPVSLAPTPSITSSTVPRSSNPLSSSYNSLNSFSMTPGSHLPVTSLSASESISLSSSPVIIGSVGLSSSQPLFNVNFSYEAKEHQPTASIPVTIAPSSPFPQDYLWEYDFLDI